MKGINHIYFFTPKNIFLLLLCTCSVSLYLGGTMFYILLIGVVLLNVIKKGLKNETNVGAWLVLIIAVISTIVNYGDTSAVFRVEQRIFLLALVIIVFSPAITNMELYQYRKRIFFFLGLGLCVVGIASTLLSFWGFGYVQGYLVGLSDFPNSLGYTLGITTIFSFSFITQTKKWYVRLMCLVVIVLCYRTIPLTGTRTAFYSLPIIVSVYILFNSKNAVDVIRKFFMFFLLIVVVLSFVKVDMSIINEKNDIQEERGENSRASLFYARQKEFEQSPIIGYGTFRGDPRYATINNNGNIEVGNTFYAFLSMNGIIGFINFVVFYLTLIIPFIGYMLKRRKEGVASFEMLLLLVVLYNFISMQQQGLALNPGLYSTGFNWLSFALMYRPNNYLKSNGTI